MCENEYVVTDACLRTPSADIAIDRLGAHLVRNLPGHGLFTVLFLLQRWRILLYLELFHSYVARGGPTEKVRGPATEKGRAPPGATDFALSSNRWQPAVG